MSLKQITRGLFVLFRRREADTDLSEEIRHYLDETTRAHQSRGLSYDQARRAAMVEIGNQTVVREHVRGSTWEHRVDTLVVDVRYALRRLRRSPAFTVISVATLALGIGSTTTIFSAVYPILYEPLPYPSPRQIVSITDFGQGGGPADVTFGTFLELKARTRSFSDMAVTKPWQPTLLGGSEPERLSGQRVSANYFHLLGIAPAAGREFAEDEDRPGGGNVVIISNSLWRRRFAASPDLVGHTIRLGDTPFTVVGIMPATFENVLLPAADAWAPLQYERSFGPDAREWGHHLKMVARLRDGVRLDVAAQELYVIADKAIPEFSRVAWADLSNGLRIVSLQQEVTADVRNTLLIVFGAVLLVLAIACVNVTNLLYARGAQRKAELSMRAALGAERGRIIRQLLTESLVLVGVGGILGVALALVGVRLIVAIAPAGVSRLASIGIDGPVLIAAIAAVTFLGLIIGILPALNVSRSDLQGTLRRDARRTVTGSSRTRGVLVVAEIALALVLVAGTVLLLRSLSRLFATPVGFDRSGLLTIQVQESGSRFNDDESRRRAFEEILDRARATSGVTAAGFTTQLPLSGEADYYGIRFPEKPNADGAALRYAVTPGYLETMRIPLLAGRMLATGDRDDAPRAAVINRSLAVAAFGTAAGALGHPLIFGSADGKPFTIVGVVGDVKQSSLGAGDEQAVYINMRQWHFADNIMTMVVRTSAAPAALTSSMRSAIWSVDRGLPILRAVTMDELISRSESRRRFALTLFAFFGSVALVLAAIGIYGVLSGAVTERFREIGVRAALGATPSEILGEILRKGVALAATGVAIGVLGALAATRAMQSLVYGLDTIDPVSLGASAALLLAVAVAACLAPAWRASRVDPVTVLRAE
jgi:putative ABC transport system permease protein